MTYLIIYLISFIITYYLIRFMIKKWLKTVNEEYDYEAVCITLLASIIPIITIIPILLIVLPHFSKSKPPKWL